MEQRKILSPRKNSVITPDDIIRRVMQGQKAALAGDHTLNPDLLPELPYRRAAVLIPVVMRDHGLSVLFTLRTAHLHAHAGQVSFPGGGAEDRDVDDIDTALRETEEEIGLARDRVRVVGQMTPYVTRTRFQVSPVIGLITPPEKWTPDSFEVAEIFEIPLDYILQDGAIEKKTVTHEGVPRCYYACLWENHQIWGATAGMLYNFVTAIRA